MPRIIIPRTKINKESLTTKRSLIFIGLTAAVVCGGYILFLAIAAPQQLAEATTAAASNVVCNGCVGTTDIADSTIRSVDIANGRVMTEDIATDAVTSGKILNGQVFSVDIRDGQVGSADIFDGTITYADVSHSFVAIEHRDDCNCGGTGWDPNGGNPNEDIFDDRITENSVVSITMDSAGLLLCVPNGIQDEGGSVTVWCNGNIPQGAEVNYAIFDP